MQNLSKEATVSSGLGFNLNSGSEHFSQDSIDPSTPPPLNANTNLDHDLRLVSRITGKFWSDDTDIVEDFESAATQVLGKDDVVVQDSEDQGDGFTIVLSKSKMKRMRQKNKILVKADYNI